MGRRRLPLIITTMEALENAIAIMWGVIYIDKGLYQEETAQILEILRRNGYIPAQRRGKSGEFFLRKEEPNAFHPEVDEIHDPWDIL